MKGFSPPVSKWGGGGGRRKSPCLTPLHFFTYDHYGSSLRIRVVKCLVPNIHAASQLVIVMTLSSICFPRLKKDAI